MQKEILMNKLLTRQNLIRLILLVFGFTIFPAIVFWGEGLLFPSSQALPEFYAKILGSLTDMGMDGMFAWAVVCTPYLGYDIFLLVKSFRGQRVETGKK